MIEVIRSSRKRLLGAPDRSRAWGRHQFRQGPDRAATLTANRPAGELVWTITSGQLPVGLTLDPDGTLSGTPTEAGSFPFTVQVEDPDRAETAAMALSIAVVDNAESASIHAQYAYPAPITDGDCLDNPLTGGTTGSGTLDVSAMAYRLPDGTILVLVTGGTYSYSGADYGCIWTSSGYVPIAQG